MTWKEKLAISVAVFTFVFLFVVAVMQHLTTPGPSSHTANTTSSIQTTTPQTYSTIEDAAYALAQEQYGFIKRDDIVVTRLTYLLRSLAKLARGGYSESFAVRSAHKIAAGWRYVRYTCGVDIKLLEFTEVVVDSAYAFSKLSDEDMTAIIAIAGIYICHGGE